MNLFGKICTTSDRKYPNLIELSTLVLQNYPLLLVLFNSGAIFLLGLKFDLKVLLRVQSLIFCNSVPPV